MTAARIASTLARGTLGLAGLGAGCVAYAALVEARAFALRRVEVPVLPAGADPVRVLHVSDLHLTPATLARQRWVAGLAALEPDLVVDTGDNLAHPDAVPFVLSSLGRLLEVPGVHVWGSNDYFAPSFKNPLTYLLHPSRPRGESKRELPWPELGAAFRAAGWVDLTHTRATLEVRGLRIGFRGVDDAHLGRADYGLVAGPVDRSAVDVSLGVTHAPYRAVLDPMVADGHDLVLAGHTHGGQVCVPFHGALVTNCDLDTARVKGLSQHTAGGRTSWLHVSAGLGTSPYAPVRFACRPEATLLTLTARGTDAAPGSAMG
ncbi:Predicted phosphohydrolase, MPP superfamily [Friedmanniella luteola]|uniref:Predicted phosphohydrolase, MPP superfamily n=1 Tax=Friedmanniella luteola TaxID=546871 RepID=A0A1H1LEE6_9ACTN|nr:metallophosphoesterase [Friedmanniella luteola]SDR72710.1 Predicted phosphohydrolase, MPP superfamily [Friedmanniella luteola]